MYCENPLEYLNLENNKKYKPFGDVVLFRMTIKLYG